MKRPIKALCRAHSNAYRKMIDASDALSTIEKAPQASVRVIGVSRERGGFANAVHFHVDIDFICAEYIATSKREGLWGWYHDPIRGRMDDGGVFHELSAPRCPSDGPILIRQRPKRQKFTAESLATYRNLIGEYHRRLDEALAEEERLNSESGWTKAWEAFNAASYAEDAAWTALLQRAVHGSRDDLKSVCSHQMSTRDADFLRVQRTPKGKRTRTLDDVNDKHFEKAQEIVRALAKSKARAVK